MTLKRMKIISATLVCLIAVCSTGPGQEIFETRLTSTVSFDLFGEASGEIRVSIGVACFEIDENKINYRLSIQTGPELSESDPSIPSYFPVIAGDDFEFSFLAESGKHISIGGCDVTPKNPFLPFRLPVPNGTNPDGTPVYLTCHAIAYWWDYSGSFELPPEGIAALRSGAATLSIPFNSDQKAEGIISSIPVSPSLKEPQIANDKFYLTAFGQFQHEAVLERSVDLNIWTPVLTNDRPFSVALPLNTDSTQEFYRIIETVIGATNP